MNQSPASSPEFALIASSRARVHRLTAEVIASTERPVRFTTTKLQTNQIYLLEESRGFNAPLHQHSSLSFPEDGLNSIPEFLNISSTLRKRVPPDSATSKLLIARFHRIPSFISPRSLPALFHPLSAANRLGPFWRRALFDDSLTLPFRGLPWWVYLTQKPMGFRPPLSSRQGNRVHGPGPRRSTSSTLSDAFWAGLPATVPSSCRRLTILPLPMPHEFFSAPRPVQETLTAVSSTSARVFLPLLPGHPRSLRSYRSRLLCPATTRRTLLISKFPSRALDDWHCNATGPRETRDVFARRPVEGNFRIVEAPGSPEDPWWFSNSHCQAYLSPRRSGIAWPLHRVGLQ